MMMQIEVIGIAYCAASRDGVLNRHCSHDVHKRRQQVMWKEIDLRTHDNRVGKYISDWWECTTSGGSERRNMQRKGRASFVGSNRR